MFRASAWQWERYHWKSELVASYKSNSSTPPADFPQDSFDSSVPGEAPSKALSSEEQDAVQNIRHKKIRLTGTFDFDRQFIVTNKRDITGPGHFLFAPFHIAGSDKTILVSRGFIPFEAREPDTWKKWSSAEGPVEILAVVQESIAPGFLSPSNPDVVPGGPPVTLWYFEECRKIVQQLPYPTIYNVYAQQLGDPPPAGYPKPQVTIEIPPSTHFGYTIEWALLGMLTIALGIGLQLVRIGSPRRRYPAPSEQEPHTLH